MLPNMAKKKPASEEPRGRGRPAKPGMVALHVKIPAALHEALEKFIAESKYRPSKTTATESALVMMLQSEGYWPESDDGKP